LDGSKKEYEWNDNTQDTGKTADLEGCPALPLGVSFFS